jgi:hypothetical protein
MLSCISGTLWWWQRFRQEEDVVKITELAKVHFYQTHPTPAENLMNESIMKEYYTNLHK